MVRATVDSVECGNREQDGVGFVFRLVASLEGNAFQSKKRPDPLRRHPGVGFRYEESMAWATEQPLRWKATRRRP